MPDINRRSFTVLAAGAAAALVVPPARALGAGAANDAIPQNLATGATLAATHTVTFDKYSLLVDGRRLVLWSGEFHPFRPQPITVG